MCMGCQEAAKQKEISAMIPMASLPRDYYFSGQRRLFIQWIWPKHEGDISIKFARLLRPGTFESMQQLCVRKRWYG